MANNERVKEAVKVLMSELNGGNANLIGATIHEVVSQDHRTLQQRFWSAMLKAQILYAENRFDPRNETSVRLAEAVKEVAVYHGWDSGLPYV
jgi:hypothetical protein